MNEIQKKNIAGLSTGIISTILFNPIDKALYLSMTESKHFFDKSIWKNPYKSALFGAGNRCISYGLYFPLIEYYNSMTKGNSLATGLLVGTTSAAMTNPLNIIKFNGWNLHNKNNNFLVILSNIYKHHGLKGFTRGLVPTIQRDSVFSVLYSYYVPKIKERYSDNKSEQMLYVCSASCIFTIFSSPFNYVRSVKYHELVHKSESSYKIICDLFKECSSQGNFIKNISKKLCLGVGTLRVGMGMSFGQFLYDYINALL